MAEPPEQRPVVEHAAVGAAVLAAVAAVLVHRPAAGGRGPSGGNTGRLRCVEGGGVTPLAIMASRSRDSIQRMPREWPERIASVRALTPARATIVQLTPGMSNRSATYPS